MKTSQRNRHVSLQQIAAREHRLVSASVRQLGPGWTAAEKTIGALVAVADGIEEHAPPVANLDSIRALASNTLLKSAARSLALEILDAARLHVPESRAKRRRVMEFIAYAWIVWKTPSAAGDWHKANEDWSRYEKTFSNAVIRGALRELHVEMGDAYSRLSKYAVHASMTSIAPAARVSRRRPGPMFDVEYFDYFQFPRSLHRALKAELILDSILGVSSLLRGFQSRALSRPAWTKAAKKLEPTLKELEWRLERDIDHFRGDFLKLREHREKNLERVEKLRSRRLPPPAEVPLEVLEALNPNQRPKVESN